MTARTLRSSRGRRGALAALATGIVLIGAALTPPAQAYTPIDVWPEVLPANTWGGYHSPGPAGWDHVSAWYAGSGTVPVCEQTQAFNGWEWNVVSQICANNTANGGSLAPWSLYSKRARIKNNSAWTHTINGAIYVP